MIGGEWIVAKKGSPLSDPLFTPTEAHALGPAAETIFLGLLDGAPRFGQGLSSQSTEALKGRGDLLVTDLRSIAVQGLVNVAVNLRLFPATGIPLPFVSQGGSSLVVMMLAVGLLQSVASRGQAPRGQYEARWS